MRAEVLEIKERLFVTAARAMGHRTDRILLRHVTPMVLPTILLTLSALEVALVMLVEAGLDLPWDWHPIARDHLGPDGG